VTTTLTDESFLAYVRDVAANRRASPGPARLRGAPTVTGLLEPSEGLREQLAAVELDGRVRNRAVADLTEYGLLATAFDWYAGGAPHVAWRAWFGLAACGSWLGGNGLQTAWCAVLGGEWELLRHLPRSGQGVATLEESTLWTLVDGDPAVPLPEEASNFPGDLVACRALLRGIAGRDHEATAEALGYLADGWIGEGDDWDEYHWGFDIQGEPVLSAIAALACRQGFPPAMLTPDQRVLLGPGLAREEPEPLYPHTFTLPTTS